MRGVSLCPAWGRGVLSLRKMDLSFELNLWLLWFLFMSLNINTDTDLRLEWVQCILDPDFFWGGERVRGVQMPPGEEGRWTYGQGQCCKHWTEKETETTQLWRPEAQRGPSPSISLFCVSLGVPVDFPRFICCFWRVRWG